MKKTAFGTLMEGALAFSVLFSLFMCIRLIVHTRDLRMYNGQLQHINAENATVQAMIRDSVDYSAQNPAIDPILKSIHVSPATATRGGR